MKIRILGNSIRLRLSQTEVKEILEIGRVQQSIRFGASARQQLHYALQKADIPTIQATYNADEICVQIPRKMADDWASSNEISLETHMPISEKETLRILVEKDFQCIDVRKGEDESDLFPNPETKHSTKNSN